MRTKLTSILGKPVVKISILAAILLLFNSTKSFAFEDVYPSSFSGPMTGGAIYCQGNTATPLTVSWNNTSCGTPTLGVFDDPITINWYQNSSLSTTGGSLVQSTSTSSSTTSDTFTPSTAILGTSYYYVTVSWTQGLQACESSSGTVSMTVSQMDSVVVVPAGINNISTTVLANACNSGSNGNAEVNLEDCAAITSYSWVNSSSTQVSTTNPTGPVLSAGTYTVTVIDANSATATSSVTISESTPVVVSWWSVTNVPCYGENNGTATTNVYGGTLPYSYAWSSTPTTTITTDANGGAALDLASGFTYTVVTTDANGCTGSNSISVTQPSSALSETITHNSDLTCHTINNGSATSNPGGGTPPYTYSWVPGGGTAQTSYTLPAGTDECVLKDAHGCLARATVSITAPAAIFATFTKLIPTCNGSSNGALTASGTGGVSPYTYVWGHSLGNTAEISGLSTGTYTVDVTDNTGCSGSANVGLGQPSALAITTRATACSSGKQTVSAVPSGGTGPYKYTWSTGATSAAVSLSAGSYTLTLNDAHSCPSASVGFSVTCPPAIKDKGTYQDVDNGGDNTMSGITVYPNPTNGQFTISGLEQGQIIEMYDYTGRKVSTISANDITMLLNLSNQSNGIYLIRILDKDGNLVGSKKVVKTQ